MPPFALLTLAVVALALLLAWQRRRAAAATAPSGSPRNLVAKPPRRPAFTFAQHDLAGIGTLEMPGGPAWERRGNRWHHPESGLVLVIQNQEGDMAGYERSYLESYNKVNIRDAPQWQRGPEELGAVQGIPTARTNGRFNNGTTMVTRDYLFFAPNNTVLLQARVPAPHAAQLAVIDYVAATFRKQ